jgi:hypothetical protein
MILTQSIYAANKVWYDPIALSIARITSTGGVATGNVTKGVVIPKSSLGSMGGSH